MIHLYIFDTEQKAITGCNFIHNLLLQYLENYNANSYFEPLQIPETAPLRFRGKWLIKLPVKEIKQGIESERWKALKNRIINMPQFNPDNLYEITLDQFNQYMNRET